MQILKRESPIFFAGQHEQGIFIFLATAHGSLPGLFGHKYHCTKIGGIAVLIGFYRRRQKLSVRVTAFIPAARSG